MPDQSAARLTGPVVVGVDGSDTSRLALDWALAAAAQRGLALIAIHAWAMPLPPVAMGAAVPGPSFDAVKQGAQDSLDTEVEHARSHARGVAVEGRLVSGPPVTAVLDVAESERASLIVLGSRGLDSFSELLIGSTGVQVAGHAHCPVVIHREHADVPPGPEAGRVVVGVDGSEISEAALAFAFQEASRRRCGLTVAHGWYAPTVDAIGTPVVLPVPLDEVASDELRTTAEALAGWREEYPDVDVRTIVHHGKAAKILIEASKGAALVAVGSRGRGGFASLLLGSVSHSVLHHAYCPVAIVRVG
jgi:nucleotide-binding universal stress UspA family protein